MKATLKRNHLKQKSALDEKSLLALLVSRELEKKRSAKEIFQQTQKKKNLAKTRTR